MRVEERVAEKYRLEGWNTLKAGWPDLFLYRIENGQLKIAFREVKGRGDVLRPDQATLLSVLQLAGLDAAVYYDASKTEEVVPLAPPKIEPKTVTQIAPYISKMCRLPDGSYVRKDGVIMFPCLSCGAARRNDKIYVCGYCLNRIGKKYCTDGTYCLDGAVNIVQQSFSISRFGSLIVTLPLNQVVTRKDMQEYLNKVSETDRT